MASSSSTAVLFGGKNFTGPLSDTWVWGGSNWSQITGLTIGTTSPPALYGASLVYDAAASEFVLFGGINSAGQYSYQTWTYSTGSSTWTQASTGTTPGQNAPAGRAFAQMAYHTGTTSVVMFGGLSAQQCLGDTWTFASGVWTLLG
jgi:hypothetical protein